jgi:malonyl-CoA decarboxylase
VLRDLFPFRLSADARSAAVLRDVQSRCGRLLSEAGAADGAASAGEIIRQWRELGEAAREAFFDFLGSLAPERERVVRAARAYLEAPNPGELLALQNAVEAPRRELLRRLSRASAGVATIVAMRRELLRLLERRPQLRAVDADFSHLLATWFNPGFLDLRRVDWNSPAALLEKIIEHEAVHAIRDWRDLRRRLEQDRRCFAFFHPQLPGEPLIFVEVALVRAIPRSIAQLIGGEAAYAGGAQPPRVAAFYSISNCESGLKGVSLGNFLIKRVAEQLAAEVPSVKRYCTLSPVPGLRKWIAQVQGVAAAETLRRRHGPKLDGMAAAQQHGGLGDRESALLYACAATYLVRCGASDLGDPVARFHLDNGARLERINLGADLSEKGLRESLGTMVNYLYDLGAVESNHQRFARGEVVASRQVLSAARG